MRLLLCLCLALLSFAAAADIYRWTDAQGKVHFSETPPAGAQRVEVKPQVMERDAATREHEARLSKFFSARDAEQAEAQKRAEHQQAEQATQCAHLRANLATLQHGGRYYSVGADGERTYYSDAQLDAARRDLDARMTQACR